MELYVDLKEHGYKIYIKAGILGNTGELIKQVYKNKKIALISDDQVYSYYGETLKENLKDFDLSTIIIEHGEKSKSFSTLPSIYEQLLDAKISRTDLIIALGGGVVGDLAGFVASTYLRGINFIQIPTSLLAQVDSSVGGKVAVDLPQGKNLVGAFYHPLMVIIDPNTLDTLDKRYISDGMGEVIKYGCIKDENLFNLLDSYRDFNQLKNDISHIIYRCIDIKRQVVEKDEKDFNERILLNFGHTLGHAIEQYYDYKKYSHGQAVAIGMVQLTKISEEAGLTKSKTSLKIIKLCEKYGLPTSSNLFTKDLIKAIDYDKKNINSLLNLVLLKEIGNSYIYKTTKQFILNEERI